MYAGEASRLNVGPVIPGLAAKAACVLNSANAATNISNSCVFEILLFMFIGVIAALLVVTGAPKCVTARHGGADMNFGHEAAEVLGVVRQVVEIGGVQVVHVAGVVLVGIAGVENHI